MPYDVLDLSPIYFMCHSATIKHENGIKATLGNIDNISLI